ncbi:39S ribosomal protein L9, mitochondrial isoform X2 [Choloepus didactylus]|uniref:39S ribosomal protein L9, mitochondrial isoform X2 n=1 Tax=Choloepus didactylus TaxID=27675 RepID=UPI00189E0E0F|nr:39S ribosomal protein L9, mitochondrial isoform X2 [Choloepus didactylus]
MNAATALTVCGERPDSMCLQIQKFYKSSLKIEDSNVPGECQFMFPLGRSHTVRELRELGVRGDLVSVKKSVGRNQLLPQGLAVYASPENKKLFEEEKLLRQEGKLEKIQTKAGEATVKFLRSCHLEVGMKNNVKWELNPEIVARHFLKNLGVVVAPHALKLPEESITRWGEYWCEVTVNGLDTVRVPMSVVNFERPKTKRYKYWLAQQAAKGMAPTSSQRL